MFTATKLLGRINMSTADSSQIITLTSQIVGAYVERNNIQAADLPALISSVHQSLATLGLPQTAVESPTELKPAVSIKKSVTPDYIICLEDGKRLKMLKRHLSASYNMTPDEYRTKWGLPSDYPMVAPNYAKARSDLALKLGLGRRAAE